MRTNSSRRPLRILIAAIVGGVTLALTVATAAAPGDLKYRGCITGNTNSEPACTNIISATVGGSESGLDGVESVTVSPDDRWVYAMARQDDSIARFKRDRKSGKLTYRGCITGDIQSDSGACVEIPTATTGGAGSGLDDVRALVISRDGASAYAVVAGQDDDAVTHFTRDPHSGELTFEDCIAGATFSGPGPVGTDACALIPSASDFGTDSGLDHPKSLILSADGKSLYVASTFDAAVSRFKRNADTGELTYKGCLTGELESGPTGSNACAAIPHATAGGFHSGLADIRGLILTGDAEWLYGVADDDDAIPRFTRDPHGGALTYDGCLSGDLDAGPSGSTACKLTPTATAGGADSGLDDLRSLVLSRNDKFAYTASRGDAAVARLARSPRSGKLSFKSCISGDVDAGPSGSGVCKLIDGATANTFGNNSGLGSPESTVVPRGGRSLYVSAANEAGVARFARKPGTGKLTYRGCTSGEIGLPHCDDIPSATPTGQQSGLDFPQFMAASHEGASLYAAIGGDDAVATFKIP